jgi:4,5-dihydroxyphthalate decarboxylase
MSKIRLSLACWDYDRTRALQDGRVTVEGVDLTYLPLRVEETFWRMLRYGEFDVAEMSTGSFLMSRDKGAPRLIGIPVFPSKTFRHSCVYVNTDSGIKKPADMAGKRVGVPEYQITMATWVRGILQHEYGVAPEAMNWFTGGEEHPGRQDKVQHSLPPNIAIQPIPADETLSGMLERGALDAMISAHMPSPFVSRHPKVRRLIPDFREVEQEYFKRTKIFPIMHTMVLREEVYEKHPWIAQSLFKAFNESKRLCQETMYEFSALKYMLAWSIDEMEKEREILGADPWAYGLAANRHVLETLVQYTYEQGLISQRLEVDSLFARNTLEEFKI